MKELKFKLLLISLFTLVISQVFVSAASVFGEGSILAPIMHYVFGIAPGTAGNEMAILFAVWLIFFVAASDIISLFTMFATFISWLIGFGLAIILANTGANLQIAKSMFGLAATMGTIGIAIILIGGFIAAMLFHFGVTWALHWLIRARIAKKAATGHQLIIEGAKSFKDVGKITVDGNVFNT
ncbi:hypothetical protein HZA33_02170 [Candidatus Pacearchaeota archaeon]|nr:hypothetical protein [Candidatus Pacearchaeota archaeon]